jgi:hypothetical protein
VRQGVSHQKTLPRMALVMSAPYLSFKPTWGPIEVDSGQVVTLHVGLVEASAVEQSSASIRVGDLGPLNPLSSQVGALPVRTRQIR